MRLSQATGLGYSRLSTLLGLESSPMWLSAGLRRSTFKFTPVVAGRLLFSTDCLSVFVTWQLVIGEWETVPKSLFVILEVTSHHFCPILFLRSKSRDPAQLKGRGCEYKELKNNGAILELPVVNTTWWRPSRAFHLHCFIYPHDDLKGVAINILFCRCGNRFGVVK